MRVRWDRVRSLPKQARPLRSRAGVTSDSVSRGSGAAFGSPGSVSVPLVE
jgi:hypothetical protein